MKVILRERVKTLGNVGEICNVSPGYARNFLFPRNLAILADDNNSKMLENSKKMLAKKMNEQKNNAEEIKKKLDGISISFLKRVNGSGRLFGTITSTEMATEINKQGFDIDRRAIIVDEAIKSLGDFETKVKLFNDVFATVNVKVEMDLAQQKELEEKAKSKKAAKKAEKKAAEEAASAEGEEVSEEESEKTEE